MEARRLKGSAEMRWRINPFISQSEKLIAANSCAAGVYTAAGLNAVPQNGKEQLSINAGQSFRHESRSNEAFQHRRRRVG